MVSSLTIFLSILLLRLSNSYQFQTVSGSRRPLNLLSTHSVETLEKCLEKEKMNLSEELANNVNINTVFCG